jgi:hypothetical protein
LGNISANISVGSHLGVPSAEKAAPNRMLEANEPSQEEPKIFMIRHARLNFIEIPDWHFRIIAVQFRVSRRGIQFRPAEALDLRPAQQQTFHSSKKPAAHSLPFIAPYEHIRASQPS